MFDFLNENYNGLTVVLNTAIALAAIYRTIYFDEKIKKEIEGYKHQLQVDFLKVQLKTTSFFTIYPKLFEYFKIAEGSFARLEYFNTQNKIILDAEKTRACKELEVANNYLVLNMIFLSPSVKTLGLDISDFMKNYLYKTSIPFNDITNKLIELENQMREELSNLENPIK